MNLRGILKDDKIRSIVAESWSLSWPMTFIMSYEFLIGLSDVYVASRFGTLAQAAYGFAFQLYFIFIIIGIALSVGIVSVVSRLYTSPDKEEFYKAVNSSLLIVSLSGLAFGIAGILFSKDLVNVLNLPQEVKPYTISFMKIYSLAFLFDYILMSINGILRACGMIKKSLWIMTIVCVMNIALNFALALGTPLGFTGIAVATVTSLFAGACISLYYVRKLVSGFRLSGSIVKNILSISWPSGLLQTLWQLGALALFLILGLLPMHNIEIMAALTNGLKIESAIFLPAFAFNMAAAVVVGNLIGKKEESDAFRGGIVTATMGVAIAGIMTILIMLNAKHIAALLSNNDIVIKESMKYIYIALISEPIMAWGVILGGGLNGAGDTMSVMKVTALSVWLVRIPLCYLLGIYFGFGAIAIWWSMNASILVQAVFITRRYFSKKWIVPAERAI